MKLYNTGRNALASLSHVEVESLRLIVRFGIAGLVNTGFSYGAFALFLFLGAWPLGALVGAAMLGVAFNFQTSCRFVFCSRGRAFRFVAVYACVLALNWAALVGLRVCGMSDLEGQALLVLPIAIISFLGQRNIVFSGSMSARRNSPVRMTRFRRAMWDGEPAQTIVAQHAVAIPKQPFKNFKANTCDTH